MRSLGVTLSEVGEQPRWDWTRLDQQQQFLTSQSKFTMFSGGFGCGKTSVLCARVLALLMLIPNNLGFLGRMDGKSLRASTMQVLFDMLPSSYLSKRNDQQGFLQLTAEYGGSKLIYGDFKDLRDLKNLPLGFFAIDQAEECPKEIWEFLAGRLRRKVPVLADNGHRQYHVVGTCTTGGRHYALHNDTQCRRCSAPLPAFNETFAPGADCQTWELIVYNNYGVAVCNPEGPSHWIFQMFPGLPGQHGTSEGRPGYEAFHATAYDGLHAGFLPGHYLPDLEALYQDNPLMWDRYLLGKWVEAEGVVYPQWQRGIHIITSDAKRWDGEPLFTPETALYEYIDHGFTAPTAIGWVAIQKCECGCERLNYYLIDEHYEKEKVISFHAASIRMHRERLPLKLLGTYLDSQAFSKILMGQTGTPRENELYSVADEFMDHGIYPVPNQKDWKAGHNRIGELLTPDPDHVHPVTGAKGAPHFLVMQHCTNFIYEIESYKWKKVRNQLVMSDEPADGNDNHMDGLNGFITSRPTEYTPPRKEDEQPTWLVELDNLVLPGQTHMAL